MNADEAERVRTVSCTAKLRYSRATARAVAKDLSTPERSLAAYRCAFDHEDGHWHVGRVPSMRTIADVAAAIRFFGTGFEGEA
jgi:hypothetical protein